MKIKVLVDSCGDVTEKIMKDFDIGMIPLNIKLDRMMLDRIDITPEEYYKKINDYDVPETSSPNLAQWKAAFDTYLHDGYNKIVVITLSSKLSNTHDQACVAAKKFYHENIKILDSMQASGGEGLVAVRFRELLNSDYSLDEAYKKMESLRKKIILVGYMENLKMLLKSGRISRASEFIASLGRMKPMITTDEGELIPLCKAISLKNAKKRTIKELVKKADKSSSYTMFVTHANDAKTADELKKQVESELHISKSFVNFMGPVVGSRVGLKAQMVSLIPDTEI